MTDTEIKERERACNTLIAQCIADPHLGVMMFGLGGVYQRRALAEAAAQHVLGTGFGWQVLEFIGADPPQVVVTRYDPPQRDDIAPDHYQRPPRRL